MSVRSDPERRLAAQVADTLTDVATAAPGADHLLNVLAFLGADDIPRRMLRPTDPGRVAELGPWAEDGRALMAALSALVDEAVITFDGSGVFMHRNRQDAVLELLSAEEASRWACSAGELVLDAMPDVRLVSEWVWAARVVRHAIVVVRHLEAMSVAQSLTVRLRQKIARFQVVQGQLESARESLERALSLVERDEPGASLHGSVLNDLADTHRRLGEFTRAMERSDAAYDVLSPSTTRVQKGAAKQVRDSMLVNDRVQIADVQQRRTGADTVTSTPQLDPDVAAALRVRGLIESDYGNPGPAVDYLMSSLSVFEQTVGTEHLDYLEAMENLVNVLLEAGEIERALRYFEECIEIKERAGTFGEDVADSRLLLAVLTGSMPAVEASQELSERYRRRYGAHHQSTAESLRLLGSILTWTDRVDEAREALQSALEVDISNLGPHHYRVAQTRVSLMRLFLNREAFDAALDEARLTLEVMSNTPEPERAITLRLTGLADAIADAGSMPGQRPFLDMLRSLIADDDAIGPATAMKLNTALCRAFWRAGDRSLAAGQIDRAEAEYARAFDLARLTSDTSSDDLEAAVRLGYLADLRGDTTLAHEYWRGALGLFGADASWAAWYLIHTHGQLARVGGPSGSSVGALEHLMDDLEKEGTVTRFRASLSSLVPEGWLAKESITLFAADGQANVIASAEPLDPSIDTDGYAGAQDEALRTEFPGYQELWVEEREVLGGRRGIMRGFTWKPDDGAAVTQIQLYFAEGGRGYTATATTTATNFESIDQVLLTALSSLRMDA